MYNPSRFEAKDFRACSKRRRRRNDDRPERLAAPDFQKGVSIG